ncbi:hypothetical protein CEXT_245811 [Caerostris extrusa]|uniref:Uncharacterized protein n=1 Tax=Caerostris extrusa TaxID=172846 RepID=A0AAV4WEH8_CAEEX|nr:hypothetical protein CEXT_245811 [Caerostris extrusa]
MRSAFQIAQEIARTIKNLISTRVKAGRKRGRRLEVPHGIGDHRRPISFLGATTPYLCAPETLLLFCAPVFSSK